MQRVRAYPGGEPLRRFWRNHLRPHLLMPDSHFFQTHAPGQLIDRVQADTMAARGGATTTVIRLGQDVVARPALGGLCAQLPQAQLRD